MNNQINAPMEKKADVLLEVSWEVCNKVGGIYTVVKSKSAKMFEVYGSNFFMIGPYFASKALGQFEEELPQDECKAAFEELKKVQHMSLFLMKGYIFLLLNSFLQSLINMQKNCEKKQRKVKNNSIIYLTS